MFSLIITIFSISLVAALAYVTYNYLDDIMSRTGPAADAALIISQAGQIAGAAKVFTATKGGAELTMQALVNEKLLTSVPVPPFKDGGQYTFTAERAVRLSVGGEKLCSELQKKLLGTTAIGNFRPAHNGCYNSDGAFVLIMNG